MSTAIYIQCSSELSLCRYIVMLTISVIANCDLERQYSFSGAWVWLMIILVIVSCIQTCSCMYFLHLFSNFIQLVPIHLFNSVPFWKISCIVSLLLNCPLDQFCIIIAIILNAVCSVHTSYGSFLWNSNLYNYYTAASSTRVRNSQLDAITEQNSDLGPKWL